MKLPVAMLLLVLPGACAKGMMASDLGDDQPDAPTQVNPDAPPTSHPDSSTTPDSPTQTFAGTLVITEVALAPAAGEFIEIANPTGAAVALDNYYVSDSGKYFQLPAGGLALDANDFIVRFPAGSSIPAGGVVTVALDSAANFQTNYGVAPTFSITSGTMTTVIAQSTPTLTNAGEVIVLFQWDGQGDLVHDVDLVLAGIPAGSNGIVDKSGVAIDGPDADTTTSTYAADSKTIHAQASAPASGTSTKRIALEGTNETHGGGNGLAGDDETSEDIGLTWDSTFTAPTPGTVPAGLMP